MSQEDLDAKFRDVTSASLGPERGETLLQAIKGGDLDQPASDFAALLKV